MEAQEEVGGTNFSISKQRGQRESKKKEESNIEGRGTPTNLKEMIADQGENSAEDEFPKQVYRPRVYRGRGEREDRVKQFTIRGKKQRGERQ